jgi:serine/threonine-protein kinase HipA
MNPELIAFVEGLVMGTVTNAKGGLLSFVYSKEWLGSARAHPLSVSMPLAEETYADRKIRQFLWGLLPDSDTVLREWAQRYQVSPRNIFGLISHVGEDCAGAVQFVRPERLDAVRQGAPPEIEWLDESGVAERLRALRQNPSAWRMARDRGQFSLAGAQPKTALLYEDGRWGVPAGRVPTTHILKPPASEFDGHAENEHFCLELARTFGLPVANSEVRKFKDEIAIVVERYDRIRSANGIHRIHQEDMCQATGLPPTQKYQAEGDPSVRTIVDLLSNTSRAPEADRRTFVDAVAFNWFIAGTDAHAKNYSLLLGAGPTVRFAPLYDLASILPYPGMRPIGLKLAMKIGGEYGLRNIAKRQWKKLAAETHLNSEDLVRTLLTMAKSMPDHVATVQKGSKQGGLTHPIIDRLSERLIAWAKECEDRLQ